MTHPRGNDPSAQNDAGNIKAQPGFSRIWAGGALYPLGFLESFGRNIR
jgi:hypothetical protein